MRTVKPAMRSFRKAAALGSALALFGCVACSTLPHNTDPQVIGSFEAHSGDESPFLGPKAGQEPDLLLRDFFTATAIPSGDYEAARSFMDPAISESWDPTESILVVDSIDLNTVHVDAGQIEYSVRGNIIGSLNSGGAYSPENAGYEARMTLQQISGEWRITDLPSGAVIERNELRNRYQPQSLYFYEQSRKALISDRRWLYSGQDSMDTELVTLLIEGPNADLKPATSSLLPETATFLGVEDGEYRFSGMTAMSQEDKTKFAAQLVWTLNNAGMGQEFRATADGSPLVEGLDIMSTDEFAEFNPQESPTSVSSLFVLYEGSLWSVKATAVQPVSGSAGTVGDIQSADVSAGGIVAAVRKKSPDEFEFAMGETTGELGTALSAKTLARPTFELNGQAAWTVEDGERIVRVVRSSATGQITDAAVDSSEVDGINGEISVIRLSNTGARIAMIIGGYVYTGVVTRATNGKHRIVNVHEVAPELNGSALSLDWQSDGSLLVGTSSRNSPVWRIEQDGSASSTMPSGNISAPVVAVAASPSTLYVTDSHAMLEMPAVGSDSSYWREVPGLQGKRSSPIIAN